MTNEQVLLIHLQWFCLVTMSASCLVMYFRILKMRKDLNFVIKTVDRILNILKCDKDKSLERTLKTCEVFIGKEGVVDGSAGEKSL